MGDLRLKAENMLKLTKEELKVNREKDELSLKESINYKKNRFKIEFKNKIEKSISGFQFNLLKSANNGMPLKIEVLRIEANFFSRANNENMNVLTEYIPIKQKVAMFLAETNFEFVADEIIEDESLQKLYTLICENDIYPLWRVEEDITDANILILLLEVNPLISLKEKRLKLQKKIEDRQKTERNAMIIHKKSLRESTSVEKIRKIKDFLVSFSVILYVSVVILTILFMMFGFFSMENSIDRFSLIALGWPYFIFTEVKIQFLFSFPLGIIFSLIFSKKRSLLFS